MLMTINAKPRIRFNKWSSMRVNAKIAIVDTTINVSSLKPGMYILKVGSQIVKFVKK